MAEQRCCDLVGPVVDLAGRQSVRGVAAPRRGAAAPRVRLVAPGAVRLLHACALPHPARCSGSARAPCRTRRGAVAPRVRLAAPGAVQWLRAFGPENAPPERFRGKAAGPHPISGPDFP
jgi:hypothetical protein